MAFFSRPAQLLVARDIHLVGTHILKTITALRPGEKRGITGANLKRQKEYATGRWCVRQALAKLGIPPQPVLRGKAGEPIWPSGVCGSISHTTGAYCAVVAFSDKYRAIGIDIENTHKEISRSALELVLNKDETIWLHKANSESRKYEKLIFCVKESAGKLFYPIIKKKLSFETVSVFPPLREGEFTFLLNENLSCDFRKGSQYSGCYFTNDEWIFTVCAISYANQG